MAALIYEEGKRYFVATQDRLASHPTRKELSIKKGDVISVQTGVLPLLFDGKEYFFGEVDSKEGYFPKECATEVLTPKSKQRKSMFVTKNEFEVSGPTVVK